MLNKSRNLQSPSGKYFNWCFNHSIIYHLKQTSLIKLIKHNRSTLKNPILPGVWWFLTSCRRHLNLTLRPHTSPSSVAVVMMNEYAGIYTGSVRPTFCPICQAQFPAEMHSGSCVSKILYSVGSFSSTGCSGVILSSLSWWGWTNTDEFSKSKRALKTSSCWGESGRWHCLTLLLGEILSTKSKQKTRNVSLVP